VRACVYEGLCGTFGAFFGPRIWFPRFDQFLFDQILQKREFSLVKISKSHECG
jgi:hypothetical protein